MAFRTLILAASLVGTMLVAPLGAAKAQVAWSPRISIVFPHDQQGSPTAVDGSQLVNVSVWPTNQVVCNQSPSPALDLYIGKDNDPVANTGAEPVLSQRMESGSTFPSLEFNDIRADLQAEPSAKYRFVTYMNGEPTGNVWTHASDPRTFLPNPLVPTGFADAKPAEVDTRIQIVWPHDEQGNAAAVGAATRVNLAVDIFEHGTSNSVPVDADYTPRLWWAQMNGSLSQSPIQPVKITYVSEGQAYPRWVFNDFPVQPGQQYHFLTVTGALGEEDASLPSIWTHAVDARTILPTPEAPPSCVP